MKRIAQELITNWHAARIIRAVFAGLFFIIFFIEKDNFALFGGLIFGYQALFNTGCCGPRGCEIRPKKSNKIHRKDTN